MNKALFVGLSPGLQKTIICNNFTINNVSRSSKFILDASGKSINAARVFAQLGGIPLCLTQIGGRNSEIFLNLADKSGIKVYPIYTNVDIRYCYTIIDQINNTTTELVVNESDTITKEIESEFITKFIEIIPEYQVVVINGSKLPGFSKNIIPDMVSIAKKQNKLVFADYRSNDLVNSLISKTIRPDFIKINKDEFEETFADTNKNFDIEQKLKSMSKKYNNTFIITQGSKPTLISRSGHFKTHIPIKVTAVNTTGCGDSFLAGLVMGILSTDSLTKALEIGNDCAMKNALNIRPGCINN